MCFHYHKLLSFDVFSLYSKTFGFHHRRGRYESGSRVSPEVTYKGVHRDQQPAWNHQWVKHYLSIYLSIYLSTFELIYPPSYLSIYLSIYLSNFDSIYLSIYHCFTTQNSFKRNGQSVQKTKKSKKTKNKTSKQQKTKNKTKQDKITSKPNFLSDSSALETWTLQLVLKCLSI